MEGARPAVFEDLASCARLLDAARRAAADLRGGPELVAESPSWTASGPIAADVLATSWARDPRRRLLAGTFDGAVVGVAVGRLAEGGRGTVGIVDCCYVDPEARGVGVGSAMAGALVTWFAAQGCTAVDAPALPGDRSTKQLFESLGFSARLLLLHRRLP